MIEGAIKGILNVLGTEKLGMFIENDWNILEALFYGLSHTPKEAYEKMRPEEVSKAERIRRSLASTVLPVINMTLRVARSFPPEVVESKVTADWLMERSKKNFPELAAVIERYGDKGRAWLDRQAEQIRLYLTGRIAYHPVKLRFVTKEEIVAEQTAQKKTN
ncbi:MAG: hypothetical protein ACP5KV_07685 [Candidatus Methanomethylicaceae archaeon]